MKNSSTLNLLTLTLMMFISIEGWTQGFPDPSNLTDTQRACLEKALGKPDDGPPPMDKVKAAMDKCINHPSNSSDSSTTATTPVLKAKIDKTKPNTESTEAKICVACEAEKNRIRNKNIDDIKKVVVATGQGVDSQKVAMQGPPPNPDEMKRHLQRVKDRMIKKIQSSPCKTPGQDDDDDSGPPDMASMMSGGDMPPGGKEMPGMDQMPNLGNDGMAKMFTENLDMMDDIQDAMDAKMEKCQKQAMRQMKSRGGAPGGGSNQMGGMSGMGMSGMGSYSPYGMNGYGNYGFSSGYNMPSLVSYNPSSYYYPRYSNSSYLQSYSPYRYGSYQQAIR